MAGPDVEISAAVAIAQALGLDARHQWKDDDKQRSARRSCQSWYMYGVVACLKPLALPASGTHATVSGHESQSQECNARVQASRSAALGGYWYKNVWVVTP